MPTPKKITAGVDTSEDTMMASIDDGATASGNLITVHFDTLGKDRAIAALDRAIDCIMRHQSQKAVS